MPDDLYQVADVILMAVTVVQLSVSLLLPLLPLLSFVAIVTLFLFLVLAEFEVQRNIFFQRSICRGTTDMYAVLSVSSCPLAVSPVRKVVWFFRNEIGERVVRVCMVNTHSHTLALTWLKVNLLEVDKTLSRLSCLVW